MKPFPPPKAAPPTVDVLVQSALWSDEPLAEQTVRDAVAAAAAAVSTAGHDLSILLTDDEAIRSLNRQWRGIDKPTNVLSFPAAVTPGSVGTRFFGDIALAYETIKRECTDEGRIFLHHLAHLTIHGFLHLCGYGHLVDAEAEEMEGLESKIMMRMSLPDPWQGRHLARETGNP